MVCFMSVNGFDKISYIIGFSIRKLILKGTIVYTHINMKITQTPFLNDFQMVSTLF